MPKLASRLTDLCVSVLFAMTFLMAGGEKLIGGHVPAWFLEQFSGTLMDVFPGALAVAYFTIAVAEVVVGALFVTAFMPRGAFLRGLAFAGAMAVFVMLAFGQRLTHKFDEAAVLSLLALATYLVSRHQSQVTA